MPFDQGTPTAEPVEEDDELAAAIALSMEEDGGSPLGPSHPLSPLTRAVHP